MGRADRSPVSPVSSRFRSAYIEPLTPSSNTSLSPGGSPASEIAFEKPSLPSAADWSEFLSASTSEKVENEFAQLTLSDHEQRELYEAARLVQTAFRRYKVERPASWRDGLTARQARGPSRALPLAHVPSLSFLGVCRSFI